MNFEKFKSIVTMLKIEDDKREAWLSSIPWSLREAFFDNEYVASFQGIINNLLEVLLPNECLEEDVNWFLFEWRPGFTIFVADKDYVINNIDDYFEYIKEVYFSEE